MSRLKGRLGHVTNHSLGNSLTSVHIGVYFSDFLFLLDSGKMVISLLTYSLVILSSVIGS